MEQPTPQSAQTGLSSRPAPFVLASILSSYPVADSFAGLPVLLEDIGEGVPGTLRDLILARAREERLEDLQSEYIALFDSGRTANPLYETEYDRRRMMAKGNDLSDIAGFYRAFGFELDDSLAGMEMLDHVGIELEFHALMLMKEIHLEESGDAAGVGIVRDARGKFLQDHLGRFVGAIGRRPGVAGSEFYRGVFGWIADLIGRECGRLGVAPVQVDWVDGEALRDEDSRCGAIKGPTPRRD